MKKLVLLLPVFLALAACGITEENVSTKYARAVCKQEKKCEQGDFERQWDNMGECVEDMAVFFEDVQDFFDLLDCELDKPATRRYLGDLRAASCEEYVEGDFGSDEDTFDCTGQ